MITTSTHIEAQVVGGLPDLLNVFVHRDGHQGGRAAPGIAVAALGTSLALLLHEHLEYVRVCVNYMCM